MFHNDMEFYLKLFCIVMIINMGQLLALLYVVKIFIYIKKFKT